MLGFCGLIGHRVLIGTDLLENMIRLFGILNRIMKNGVLNRIMKNGVLNRIMKNGVLNRIMKNVNINNSKSKQVPLITVSDRLSDPSFSVHWTCQLW